MASVKLILRPQENADGTRSLCVQIVSNRKTSLINSGHRIKLSDWDEVNRKVKRSYPNSVRLNHLLSKLVMETTEKVIEMESAKKDPSAAKVKRAFKAEKEGTFFDQADLYLKQLKQNGKFNSVSAETPRIARFKEFAGSDITFPEITTAVLRKFTSFLRESRDVSERTVVNHLIVIRTVYNRAVAAGVVDKKNYPFGKGKIVIKFPDTMKMGLSPEEIKSIESAELPAGENHARNLFLISFYFAGMRISDVLRLKWSDFHDGRLYYSMGKNAKAGSLKVSEKVSAILKQYERETKHDLVFPDLINLDDLSDGMIVQNRIKTRVRSCNDYLKNIAKNLGIKKKLSMHISRHSFAQLAGDNISVQVLQALYRHSSITTTINYQGNFVNKKIDGALDTVLDF